MLRLPAARGARAFRSAVAVATLLFTACSGADAGVKHTATDAAAPSAEVSANATAPPIAEATLSPTVRPDSTPRASAEVVATRAANDPTPAPAPAVTRPEPTATPAPAARGFAMHPFVPAGGRQRVIALDPGHGGEEVGAAGAGVTEKEMNLDIARKLKALLEADGHRVVMTRDSDRRAVPVPEFPAPAGWQPTRTDLQARLDIANAAGADVFLSIHNNGSSDARQGGTEVWYDGRRPFAAYNLALAESLLDALIGAIRAHGYPTVNRGLQEDTHFRVRNGRSFPIFVLGPPRTGAATTRAGAMPAALGETLFLSNPFEAQFLAREDMRSAIARGYRDGLRRYFALIDSSALAPPAEGYPPETPNYYDTVPPGVSGGG